MKKSTSVHNVTQSSQAMDTIGQAPTGWKRFLWLGPSFLWMLSAAGSGEVLFTPRIAALYGYTLLWALLAAVMLKWFINREVGRYTVCTGRTFINGCHDLPGPTNWAIWLILIPQLAVAVATIAGMAGAAADAVHVLTGGSKKMITLLIIVITGFIVLLGRYKLVEVLASVWGIVLSLAVITAAITIFPDGRKMIEGLMPTLPDSVKYEEVLPWLGFMLAGAAGLMWFSNWVQARGYGAATDEDEDEFDISDASDRDKKRLHGWLRQMSISNTLAVIGALLIAIAFLILGSELLQPKGLVPEEDKMSEVLGKLLGELWGPFGFWFMIGAVFISFWTTALTNQDGWGRMFSSGTKMLLRQFNVTGKWTRVDSLRKIYIVVLLIVLPCGLYLLMGKPVSLLMVAGGIEAGHIPVVACLVLYLNKTKLPQELAPSPFSFWATAIAGLFFVIFAVFYILEITGVIST
jgi:Mn2+/Fe2+ NRAMP family transporter